MKQLLDGLEAAGLNPIVIDENFDFSQLAAMLGMNDEQVDVRPEDADHDTDAGDILPAS